MAVLTIEYQMGCGGRDIGRMLAGRLNLDYVDREIVKGVAQELHIQEDTVDLHDERVAGMLERALRLLSVPGEMTWMAPLRENSLAAIDETVYHTTTCRVIEAAARRDRVVIVGHGASFALAGWPGVMHVGLHAPADKRIATVMERLQLDREAAQHRVTQSDLDRARYIKRFYQANWRDADHYHLMIDTTFLGPDRVVELIATAWGAGDFGGS
jgi:cytidylate kinase